MNRERETDRLLRANWRLSFGDLLTLILCFFISLAHSPKLTKTMVVPASAHSERENSSIVDAASGLLLPENGGTPFATQSERGGLRQFWLTPSMYEEDRVQLKAQSITELKRFLESVDPSLDRVSLRICGAKESEAEVWLQSLSRAVGVTDVLKGLLKSANGLSVEVRGAHCDEGADIVELHQESVMYG